MQRFVYGWLGILLLAGTALAVHIDADPSKEYPVTKDSGEWLICAASYRGPDAASQAHGLCLEIRQKYTLPAYVYDRGKEERRGQEAKVKELWDLSPDARVRITRVEEQWAVLVGGYKDIDSARKALEDFKKLKVPDKFCARAIIQEKGTDKGQEGIWTKEVSVNPFLSAFVAHNPTLLLQPENDKLDYSLLKKLNSGESLSLLSNPKKWTLAVKSLSGPTMIQDRSAGGGMMDKLGFSGKAQAQLDAAGLQAHALADLLRKIKPVSFESYVLHTRNSSVVTIGSYDSMNDPKMLQDKQLLSKLKLQSQGGDPTAFQLFPQPLPMEVPKP